MKHFSKSLMVWLVWLAAVAAAPWAQAATATVADDRGQTLRFEQPARRVVSLLPSLTESVCALGACDRLVGVDRYSIWPESVKRLPQLGGGLDPNIEAIVALRPDVVLVSEASRVTDRLTALGIRVLALRTKTQTDVHRALQRLGVVLGLPPSQAEAAWARIQQGIAQAAQQVRPEARQARVYIEVSRGPYAAGESSFIGETLHQLGLRNVVPREQGPFPRLNPEFVVRANPDLIMLTNRAEAGPALYPGWEQLRAVREHHVCRFDPAETDVLIHPGPRMDEAARVMVRCINSALGKAAAAR